MAIARAGNFWLLLLALLCGSCTRSLVTMRDLHRQQQHIANMQERDFSRGILRTPDTYYLRVDLRLPKPRKNSLTQPARPVRPNRSRLQPHSVGRELPQYYRNHGRRYHAPTPVLAPEIEPLGEGSAPVSPADFIEVPSEQVQLLLALPIYLCHSPK